MAATEDNAMKLASYPASSGDGFWRHLQKPFSFFGTSSTA